MINVTPVILCGGSGARLWSLSRFCFSKQFLCLAGKETLFQQAALRLGNIGNSDIQVASPINVIGEDHRFLVSEQLREIGVELGCGLLEPVGKNTAPALTLAALEIIEVKSRSYLGEDDIFRFILMREQMSDTKSVCCAIDSPSRMKSNSTQKS